MNHNQLDLDIGNYSIKEIERFFRLQPNEKYTATEIEKREYSIREQLLKSGHVSKEFKRDLIFFLEKAREWLVLVRCEQPKTPTTLPPEYPLDKLQVPASLRPPPRDTTELIQRQQIPYIYSHNEEYIPGNMNPLKTRVITKVLNIDSRFRDNIDNTDTSDFSITLPTKISKVVSMQLAGIEFPVSFYGISSYLGNNFLYLAVNYNSLDGAGDVIDDSTIITIPDGNYLAQDFIDTINALLAPNDANGALLYPQSIYSYIQIFLNVTTAGSGTGRITIYPKGTYAGNVNNITLDFTRDNNGNPDTVPVSQKIGWNLGFTKAIYKGDALYTGETILEPAAIRYFYLVVDDFNNNVNNHFTNIFKQSIMSPNILAKVAIKASFFSLIMESDFNIITEPRNYFGPVDIQRLRIQLMDDHGRLLQMNHCNFSFCLNFKTLYDF
jgi:hypothetical protein